jgi:hypothetical protein
MWSAGNMWSEGEHGRGWCQGKYGMWSRSAERTVGHQHARQVDEGDLIGGLLAEGETCTVDQYVDLGEIWRKLLRERVHPLQLASKVDRNARAANAMLRLKL